MAVPIVSATATTNLSSATSHAVNLPAHSEGDLLVMVLSVGGSATPTVSDWTNVYYGLGGSSVLGLGMYAKMAGASEGSTKTISVSSSSAIMATVSAIDGAADIGVTPIVRTFGGGGSTGDQIAPQLTATNDDSLIIVAAADAGGGAYSGTLSGYTLIANLENATSFDDMCVFYRNTGAAAGTVAAVTVSASTAQNWAAYHAAIAPSSGGASYIPAFVHHRKLLGVQ